MTRLAGTAHGIRYVETLPAEPSGDGTYLLLHGLGGSLEQWRDVADGLGRTNRTTAIDLPGFGQSSTLHGRFDLTDIVGQILAFCAERDIANCTLVSHSIGSIVAANLATAEPNRFRRVVFVSGTLARASDIVQHPISGLATPRLLGFVAAQFVAGMLPVPRAVLVSLARSAVLRRVLLWPFVAHPADVPTGHLVEILSGTGSLSVASVLFAAKSIDHAGIVSAVRQPVEIISGSEDRLIDGEDIARMRQMVHVVRELRIDNCGHWPWLEDPATVVDFISGRNADEPSENQDAGL